MGPADALSQKDHLDTTTDNVNTPILPDPMVINALDLTLSCYIQSSSASDPFVHKALTAVQDGSPLFTHATLSDWLFDNGHLYFRNRMYVPPSACSALLHSIHSSPLSGHMGSSTLSLSLSVTSGGRASLPLSSISLQVVLFANRTRLTLILRFPLSV